MKKSNVIAIATILIALHLLLFAILVGSNHKKSKPGIPAPTPAPMADTAPESLADFSVPELDLQIPKPAEQVMPVEVVEMAPAQPRPTIAVPGSREGYLRSDRPAHRTTQVYDNLVGDPFQSAIVVDAGTGKILFERRSTAYAYPASITKLMTLLLVLEHIQSGQTHLTDKVAITKEACGVGGSQAYLDMRESGEFTVDDLLYALMVHSANDAAAALAIHVAGSVDAFVDLMNQRAQTLGMASTTYHTPHGLPPGDGKQPDISTAYDVALLSLETLRHKETLRYTGTSLTYLPLTPLRKEKFMLANRNALAREHGYPGCDGLKTGYHDKGGFSLAATAEQNGRRIVAVALGCPDKATRTTQITKLLNDGFQSAK